MNRLLVCCLCGLFVLLGCKAELSKTENVPETQAIQKMKKIQNIARDYWAAQRSDDYKSKEIGTPVLFSSPKEIPCYKICEKDDANCADAIIRVELKKPYWKTKYSSCREESCMGEGFEIYIDDETEKIICMCVIGIK